MQQVQTVPTHICNQFPLLLTSYIDVVRLFSWHTVNDQLEEKGEINLH